jgi:uncharacterized protein (TIGR03435 family)
MVERGERRLLLLIAITMVGASCLGQTSATQPASSGSHTGVASAGAPAAVFEAATVKRNKSGKSGSDSNFTNGRFVATNVTLKNVMQYEAYGLPEARIVGGPKWLDSERFDIEAKMDASTAAWLKGLSRDERRLQRQAMFQQLLADRFKLVTHWETRELPIYALVVAKGGAKLGAWKESEGGPSISVNDSEFTAHGVTMADLAGAWTQELSRELGRVVVDRSGIDGRYDVAVTWTPDSGSAADEDGAADSGASIFTEIQEQLGLKLESAKGPVQVLVVDGVEMATGN